MKGFSPPLLGLHDECMYVYMFGTEKAILRKAYGVAIIGRILKIIGLFCKRALHKRLYSAKETYRFEEPTNRSQPMLRLAYMYTY